VKSSTQLPSLTANPTQFRLHTKAKPEHLDGFFAEWNKYLKHVERVGREKQLVDAALIDASQQQQQQQQHSNNANTTNRRRGFGQDVSADVQFNDEQKEQLRKLREEAVTAGAK
jgi:mannitol-1-phosphate/altronate dehydrogenase